MYSEKPTKFDKVFKILLKLLQVYSVEKSLEILSYFCGLLRINEQCCQTLDCLQLQDRDSLQLKKMFKEIVNHL